MNNDQNNQNGSNNDQNRWDRQNGQNQNQNGQYYNPNGQYYNPNGQYYNPNGQYYNGGYQNNPYGGNGQFNPDSFFHPPVQANSNGKTAQTFGIVALVGLLFCTILSIVFGALAISNAKKSVAMTGYLSPEAKSGRIMGWIGLVGGIVSIAISIFSSILILLL